ncbi:tetratricopeptide repeat protein [Patescibacteria group bacterium]|nr:tetratricopeptide repeat protein [Patescibacteria group bacterium]
MHSLIKIFLIILLVILLSLALWHFNVRIFLADYYYQQVLLTDQWPEILSFYQKVFYLQPKEPFYHQKFAVDLKWGLQFYQSKEFKIQILDLAIDQMDRIPEKDRSFGTKVYLARLAGLKAEATQKQEDFLIAEQMIEKASEMSPKVARVYNEWCQIKIYEKEWEQAREMCKKAFYLYPPIDHPQMNMKHRNLVVAEMSEVYEKLGEIYLALGNYEKAESMYRQILKFYPLTRTDLWKKLGDIYYLQNDLDTAIERNFHGYILKPNDSFWSLTLGLLYQEKGDMEKALVWGENALRLDPENEEIKNFLQRIKGDSPI